MDVEEFSELAEASETPIALFCDEAMVGVYIDREKALVIRGYGLQRSLVNKRNDAYVTRCR